MSDNLFWLIVIGIGALVAIADIFADAMKSRRK